MIKNNADSTAENTLSQRERAHLTTGCARLAQVLNEIDSGVAILKVRKENGKVRDFFIKKREAGK